MLGRAVRDPALSRSGPRVDVRLLRPDEWRAYRDLRLAALAEAPDAFGSTLAREAPWSDADWRDRLAVRTAFVALAGGAPVGTAGARPEGHEVELVGMWVHPASRGRGVGDLLVAAVLDWAAGHGSGAVYLWVVDGNAAAERLYARHGFRRTGEVQPVRPEEPDRIEVAMHRPAGPPSGRM